MDRVFIDGTFTLAPPLFGQVFVIVSKRAEYMFPVMYTLLPNKRHEAYDDLFGLIKTIWPLFGPTSISLDFEMAVMNSVRQVFPRAELHGCLFHRTKSMRRQLSETTTTTTILFFSYLNASTLNNTDTVRPGGGEKTLRSSRLPPSSRLRPVFCNATMLNHDLPSMPE